MKSMNLEKFQHVGEKIDVESPEERESILYERINEISLIYAEKKFQEIVLDNSDYKFSEAVRDFTPLRHSIMRSVNNLRDFGHQKYKIKVDKFLDDFFNEIDDMHDLESFNIQDVLNLVETKRKAIIEYLELDNSEKRESNKEERDTKMLNYNQIHGIGMPGNSRYDDLQKLGFSKIDRAMEVHVDDFYRSGQDSLGSDLINQDLSVIAENIIDECPEAVAVVGRSWLLDTPLAKRIGFKDYDSDDIDQNDLSTWLQFIDRDGQINQKRFNSFIETGKLPFKSKKAYMEVEDFLKRYLPENRKGKIILKKLNEEKKEFITKTSEGLESLKDGWDKSLEIEGGFKSFYENESLNQLLDILGPEKKHIFFEHFKVLYDKKVTRKEFALHPDEELTKIDKEMGEVLKSTGYDDREVIIE